MGWRYVFIEKANRLNYRLNCIGVARDNEVVWICLDEIDTIIVEDTRCNTSIRLLSELAKKGISLIICGENHIPCGSYHSIVNNARASKYIRKQVTWDNQLIKKVWQMIVQRKIALQTEVLVKNHKRDKVHLMVEYLANVELGDITNREGHAAKVYFHQLFGENFTRERDSNNIINSSLNFIYHVIRSKISQEIIAHGYSPCFGIFHCSEYNYFALADDIIEVFRPFCDHYVYNIYLTEKPEYMNVEYKEKLLRFMYHEIKVKTIQKVREAITTVVNSILEGLSQYDENIILFPDFLDD